MTLRGLSPSGIYAGGLDTMSSNRNNLMYKRHEDLSG